MRYAALALLVAVATAQDVGPPAPEPAPPIEAPTTGAVLGSPPVEPPPTEQIEADLDNVREDLAESADKLDALIKLMEERAADLADPPESDPLETP